MYISIVNSKIRKSCAPVQGTLLQKFGIFLITVFRKLREGPGSIVALIHFR